MACSEGRSWVVGGAGGAREVEVGMVGGEGATRQRRSEGNLVPEMTTAPLCVAVMADLVSVTTQSLLQRSVSERRDSRRSESLKM